MKSVVACLFTAVLAAQSTPPPVLAVGEWLREGGRPAALGAMVERRTEAAWTVTVDGRILASGGSPQATSEWFDSRSRTFKKGPALVHPRSGHRALRLKDGRVLLLGGTDLPRPAEVSDVAVTGFQALPGNVPFSLGAEAVELVDGKVLMVDGASGKAWVWDGKKAPSSAGALSRRRVLFRLTALPDGKVLISGGLPEGKPQTAPLPLELGNPKRGLWSALKAPVQPRARHHATLLADGTVLLWGGHGADPKIGTSELERVDPAKDKVAGAGSLHTGWGVMPAVASAGGEAWWIQADRGTTVAKVETLALVETLVAGPSGSLQSLNRFQEATLVATSEGCLLLGTALSGPNLERWDPRTKHSQPFGVLRPGTEGLVTLPDKRVLAVGPRAVDVLDLKTGVLTPLGWREELTDLLKKAKGLEAAGKAFAKWPKGEERKGHVLVPLDKTRALVVAGSAEGATPVKGLGIWDSAKKKVLPAGVLDTARRFTGAPGEGALRLPDGSVAVWGGVSGM